MVRSYFGISEVVSHAREGALFKTRSMDPYGGWLLIPFPRVCPTTMSP